jgi:hypothetical protein
MHLDRGIAGFGKNKHTKSNWVLGVSEFDRVSRRHHFLKGLLAGLFVVFGLPDAGQAEPGDVLFTLVRSQSEDPGARRFGVTRQTLMDLPQFGFETSTIWTQGPQRFEGVWLADLMHSYDVTEGVLQLRAINDYLVEIPMDEVTEGRALLAHSRNGMPMNAREKGPVWVVYNYDSNPAFRTETIYSRSVWQLDQITISR